MSDDIVVLRGLLAAANSNVATLAQANRRLTERVTTTATDAAYLAIIDDLEARITALEAAARDLLKTARVGYTVAIQARQDDGLVSEMVASCERMAALLGEGVG